MAGKRTYGNSLTLVKSDSEQEDLVIGNIASIGGVASENEDLETTTLDSPNNSREFIQGLSDSGEMTVEINNVFDGTIPKLDALQASGDVRDWVVGFTDNDAETPIANLAIKGHIKRVEHGEHTVEGITKFNMTIRLSGRPVYSEPAVSDPVTED